jgi:hypothetical protein
MAAGMLQNTNVSSFFSDEGPLILWAVDRKAVTGCFQETLFF